jgi:hypothetical protein
LKNLTGLKRMTMPEYFHDLFISYAEADLNSVLILAEGLEKAGYRTWHYKRDALPGPAYLTQVIENIDKSRIVLVIISADSLLSTQVYNEITYAHENHKSFMPILKGINHFEFQKRRPDWRMILGAYTTIQIPEEGVNYILGKIIEGINAFLKKDSTIQNIKGNNYSTPTINQTSSSGIVNKIHQTKNPGIISLQIPDESLVQDLHESHKTKDLIFFSSKSEDFDYTQCVYTFLKDRGYNVFFSQQSLAPMGRGDYRKEIDRALDASKHMIVVTSKKEHVEASWVEAEWGLFINEKRSGRKSGNIITLITGTMRIEDLPSSLRYYKVLPLDPDSLEKILNYLK